MSTLVYYEGEAYLAVDAVARCYGVETAFLEEIHELGIVVYRRHTRAWLVPVIELDRIAELVRLCVHLGLTLDRAARLYAR